MYVTTLFLFKPDKLKGVFIVDTVNANIKNDKEMKTF